MITVTVMKRLGRQPCHPSAGLSHCQLPLVGILVVHFSVEAWAPQCPKLWEGEVADDAASVPLAPAPICSA